MKTTLELALDKALSNYNAFVEEEKNKRWNKLHELFRTLLIETGYPYSIGLYCSCGKYLNVVGFDGNAIDYDADITMYEMVNNYNIALIAISEFAFEISGLRVKYPSYMSFDYIGDDKEMFEKSLKSPYDKNGKLRA